MNQDVREVIKSVVAILVGILGILLSIVIVYNDRTGVYYVRTGVEAMGCVGWLGVIIFFGSLYHIGKHAFHIVVTIHLHFVGGEDDNSEATQTLEDYLQCGITAQEASDYGQAIECYTQALKLDPKSALAHNNRGNIYRDQGYLRQALADYNYALEIDPQYALAHYNRGIVHYSLDKPERALADFTRVLEIDPQYVLAYYNRGLVYRVLGDSNRAIQDFEKVLVLTNDPMLRANAQAALGSHSSFQAS